MSQLLTEKSALELALDLLSQADGYPRHAADVARALLRAQKTGQIKGLSEALENGCDCDFCDELQERLSELRAELAAMEAK
jgi:hypothetical protein